MLLGVFCCTTDAIAENGLSVQCGRGSSSRLGGTAWICAGLTGRLASTASVGGRCSGGRHLEVCIPEAGGEGVVESKGNRNNQFECGVSGLFVPAKKPSEG